ncbi:MAG TPA: penicillin-binding protein 2 [Gammaproteobacteria bacterium]|nr:penicillin-binding protein 2 [Gammaproteobacteria bacterium]
MQRRVPLKDHLRETHLFTNRALVAMVCVVVLLGVVIARMVYLQILGHEHFSTLSEKNRVDIVPVPPTRGLIYDRNGVLLAQNIPSFSLEIVPEQVSDLDQTLRGLGKLVAISAEDLDSFHRQLQRKHPFEAIPLRFRLSEEEVARFAVNRHRFPGVDIQARLTRDYPLGKLAVHVVGYMGRISEDELKRLDTSNYRGTSHIGKTGVERFYEGILHGAVGHQQVETNASGRVVRVLSRTPSRPGYDIYLTLDADLQAVAQAALGTRRGAVVAIEPQSGQILTLVSQPGFDPNAFVRGISRDDYAALRNSHDQPLFNRALRGLYPPGSTLKPFIGLAGLEYREITAQSRTFCPGWYSLEGDDHKYRDWKRGGHGTMTLRTALMQSCDVYFYDLALALGIDRIHAYLSHFGFGRPSGVDLPGEAAGLLPSRQWKRRKRRQAWFPGETLITGIGQGFTLTTPLQLAAATATLANGGTLMRPQILRATRTGNEAQLNIQAPVQIARVPQSAPEHWGTVVDAMEAVVHNARGTAHAMSRAIGYKMAGKTGTAQVFGIAQDEEYDAGEIEERLRDHALFIAFAPVEHPKIAVAVIVENGGSGGAVAGPVARAVIDHYLSNQPGGQP